MALAILNADGLVVSFVRDDVPGGWRPPHGFTVVPQGELPANWQYAPRPMPPVPESVTARQIRLWLVSHGISLAAVDVAINAIPDTTQRDMVRVEWEYAPYVERSHPMLVPLAAALGMTAEQVDAAFVEAAGL